MCRFFKKIEPCAVKYFTGGMILAPVAGLLIYKNNTQAAYAYMGWLFGAIVSTCAGYALRDLKKCPLPHLPENMQIEGQPDSPRVSR